MTIPVDGAQFPFGFRADSKALAVGRGDGSVSIYDLPRGAARDLHGRHNAAVQAVAFAPDGKTLVTTGDDTTAIVWNTASGEIIETLSGHNGRVPAAAFSTDSFTLYTVSLDGSLIGWDLSGERRLGRPFAAGGGNQIGPQNPVDDAPTFDLSPDGRWICVTQADGAVVVRDAESLAVRATLGAVQDGAVLDVVFSPDGTVLAAGGAGGQVTLWDTRTWRRIRGPLGGPGSGIPKGARENVRTIAFSPDGATLAAGTEVVSITDPNAPPDLDGRVFLWDVQTGSPDGQGIGAEVRSSTSFSARTGRCSRGRTTLWISTRSRRRRRSVAGRRSGVFPIALSSIASTWTAATHAPGPLRSVPTDVDLPQEAGPATCASSMPAPGPSRPLGSRELGLGAVARLRAGRQDDRNRRIGRHGQAARCGQAGTGGDCAAGLDNIHANAGFTPDGERLFVVYSTGEGYRWDVEASVWQKQACLVAGRNLSREEWEQFLPARGYDPSCAGTTSS